MSDENGVEISQEDGARPLSKDIVMLFPTGNVVPSHFDLTNVYHPRQDATTVVLHDNGFFELQRSKLSKYSSWFIDQRVSDSSYLYFSNKIDPRFILLPYLEAAPAKFSPIDQLIHSSPLNADGKTERLPLDRLNEWKMYEICDINDKLGDDMILYRFNKDKTLAWLRNKVDKVANIIATQRTRNLRRNQSLYVDSFNSGSRPVSTAAESLSANYAEVNNDDIKASVEIICDQLTDNMAQALCESYTLSVDEVLVTKAVVNPLKRKADWEVALEQEKEELSRSTLMGAKPASMTDTGRGSTQQHSSSGAPTAAAGKANGASSGAGGKAMKANAVAAKGTKSINSFFGGAKSTK